MKNISKEEIQLLIIGSGMAGYTAAIYASRASLHPVLYQGMQPGGQLTITTDVENYPGFPLGIQGPELMIHFEKQAQRMGADLRYGHISKVDFSSHPHKVWVDDEKLLIARAIIIATGASAKWLGLDDEERLTGYGVSARAVCDGYFFRDKEVAVVGGGDTAAEEALFLSRLCTTVHLIIRRNEMRASMIMQERVKKTDNIKIYWNSEINEILGDKAVEAIRIRNNKNGALSIILIKGVFIAIGHSPNTEIFQGYLDMDDLGYLKTKVGNTLTNIEGVFAAGDVQDRVYRQAVTAAGSGCMAALDAERFLRELEMRN